ncbi:ArnT family glycosyltransferase [Fibrella forsythiae]|uniref:Glycosyltransferase family 39 protein n=1 Tax=Fibrella forsythiae TaxID=2817061 RepID=A0ABS3JQW1_9BACT|nr:glycosyltransferase family 39 protein [Fibrella forsythiae]MBO0952399.1 glycosyltransferase family 39 protein [Fibrella forsythiae]
MISPAPLSNRLFYTLLTAVVAINFTALCLPIMEPDNGLYATVAKRMFLTGDYINLYSCEVEWLDKPRLPFLLNVLFMKMLGVTTAAYKLPALLCFGGSLFYTYRFARLNYPIVVAQVATLIFGTAYHVILSNTDVRAEPFLTLFIIGPAYHFMRVVQGGTWYHLVLGSLLTACAMMTKGPVVPVASVGAGLVAHCAFTGQWKQLWHPRWLVAGVLTALFVSPELYALYQQFDAHPEKIVYGQRGTSGLRFFFWDSQMGRFLNNGPLRGSGDPLFFTHTLLWALLPWALIVYAATGRAVSQLFRRQHLTATPPLPEYLSLGAGISLFILFSASRFQLPHYLNIVFPFYAVLAAHFLSQLSVTSLRRWTIAQTIIALLAGTLVTGVLVLYQPERLVSGLIWICLIGLTTIVVFWHYKPHFGNPVATLTGRMVGLMVIVGGLINLFLYPSIMQYQAGMVAADYANTRPNLQRTTWFYGGDTYGESTWSYEYYTKQPTHYVYADSTLKRVTRQGPVQVLTTPVYADSLTKQGFQVRRLATFPYYHVSQLTGTFLNPATRPGTLKAYILAEVQ